MVDIRILETPEDFSLYDTWVKAHPQGSLWQSLEWKRYQEALGREVRVYVDEREAGSGKREAPLLSATRQPLIASAMVVIDRTTGGFGTWDMPRGPLWTANSGERLAARVLDQIVEDAKKNLCLTLSLSPPRTLPAARCPLVASQRHEQPEATRIIDLTQTEDAILAQMHPKGRYNIRVAQKHCVRIEHSDDVEAFYGLLRQTAGRDGFRILPLRAYKAFLECLPGSFLLLAGSGERGAVAGLMGVMWGQTGIYYYGASDYAHRALMAPYALQWEAMRMCKRKGCTTYDLLGVAPHHDTSHPWAGVSAFKEKFGGTAVMYPPEQQIILWPVLWKMLQWKRWIAG